MIFESGSIWIPTKKEGEIMPLIRRCTICGKNKQIIPGELVCHKCFPEVYDERLNAFIKKLKLNDEDKKELKYLLQKFLQSNL